ncbi:MAG TPA: immunoglobulin domain-containing protein, partial [Lacunisphaera sp.]|nr:immunoglobulin domain-containing protein [Lacunisphaera sp.]
MKKLLLGLALIAAGHTAWADAVADKIAAGRAALIAHDLPTAHARFQEAYDLDTDHTNQTASALLGITRVIDVTSQSASGTFMDGLGFTGSRDPYNWTAGIAHDVNGNPVVPANYNLTTVASFWQNTLVPESVAARGNLAQVTNSSFLLTLSSAETKMPMALNIDYGDILMMQACLRAAEFLAHMGSGQNLDLNLDAALQAMQGNMLTVQKVLSDNPNLLTAGDSSERAAGQAALLDMISLYRQASTFIRNRPAGVSRLFMLTAADLPQEAQFRQMLDRLEQSVTAPVDLNGKSVYTAPLFGGTWSVRAQLPTFTATGFDVTTIPDATLGGILSGFTKEALAAALSNQHDTVAEIGWSWVTPQPMGNTLYKYLALPDGHHLVTGNGGTSLTSSDGTNWTYHRIPGIGQFVDVACDATGHLAGVTADGFIFYSTDDGASWQRVYRSDTGFNAVAYGGGKFVAVGYWGMVVTSTDGQHWSEVSSTGYSNYRLLYTGSQFVLGSQDDVTQNAVMLTSPDGLSWTERFNSNLSGASVFGLAQNGSGVIVGVLTSGGQELTSTNGGTSWSVGPGPGVASGITYSLGKFVAVGSQTLQVETATAVGTITTAGNASITVTGAGITGSPLTIPVPVNLNDTASTWAAAVRTALGGTPAITSLYTVGGTGTAITLTRIVAAANDNTLNIAIANGTAAGITAAPTSNNTISGSLTGGTGTIRVSSDNGATWTTATSASANGLTNAFAGTGATYVLGVGGLIQSSTDNATFTRALTLTTAIPTIGNKGLLALKAMDGKLFVGGGGGSNGSGTIFYSSDGQSFTEATLPGTQNNITDFLRVNSSLYYAVGNGGLILKSTDGGLNWTSVSSGTTSNILSITYLNGQFLATAAGSRVLVSADGTTWTNYSLPIGGMQMNGIAYGNGTYVAVGGSNNSGSPFSYVLTSTTAASGSWTQRNVPTTETLKGIVFNNGVFTAVGTGGTIVRSTDGVNWWGAGGKLGTNVTCISVLNGRYYAGLNLANLDSSHLISQSAVLISSNGDDWVQVPLGTANTPNRVELFNNRLYTANGNATIMRSESLPAESAPVVNVLTPNTTAPQGHTVTLAVGVPAGGGLTYQWKKDGNAVSGATGSDLVLNNVQSGDGGSYTVDVTNAAGTTTSAAITLGVSGTPSAPTIVSQPESQTVHTGFDASFSVEATGTTPFTYVWTKDGVTVTDGGNVSGATTDTLVITGATAANAGRYQVTVGNGAGNTPSLPADLVVDSVPAYNYTTLAGSPGQFATTDGTGGTARFDKPWGVAVDASGNVYVSSPQSHTIRKVTSAGVVTTIAGQAYTSGSTDATGTAARFNMPYGIALNPAGTVLYIADNGNGKIRMLDLTTLAVTTLTSSASTVNALVVDSSGNVYYTAYDHTVRKVTSGGSVSVFAGSAGAPSFANGTGSGARFNTPQGITMDAAGTYLYVADTGNGVIRRILVANQSVTTYAGQPNAFGSDDGSAAGAKFGGPLGIAIDSSGNVYVADDYADTIRKIGANGFVVTIGGQPYADGFNNAADGDARFAGPAGLAVDGSGNLFLAEQYNQIIRKGAPAGSLTAPVIWLSPQALTLNAGNTAVFGAVASGTTTLSYQWLKNGVALTDGGNVSGSATAVLTLTNIQPGDAAGYAVVVTGNGTARSAAAQLAVTVPPTISAQPSAQSLSAGGTINLSVTATDTGDITYQWRRNGFAIPGAIGSSYSLSNAQAGDGGTYDVLITGINGTITSTPVNVTVAPSNYPGVLAPDTTYPANPLLTLSTRIYAVIPLSGGKWMVGGEFVQWDATPRTFLARLNSDFSLDLGFTPPALNNYVYALAAASDGSVYVGGDFTSVDGNLVPGLFRLDSSGAYDRSWRPRDNPPAGGVSALAVQSDGKLLVARQSLSTGEPVPANTDILRRLNTDGTLDGTFSVNINANNNFNNKLVAVFVESNGSIAFGGNFTAVNGSSRGGVARVDSTGATLDTAFGGTQGANNMVYSMTQVSGGGYLIAGTFGSVAGSARNKVAIINGDGSLNAFAPPSINGNVLGAAQDANGKIVVTGTFTTVNGQATDGVVRLTAGGSVDTLYPSAATTTINTTSRSSFVFPLSDGRIALFGAFTALLNQPRIGMGVLAADGSVASSPAPLLYRPAYDGTAYPVTGGKSVVFGSIDLVGSTITNQAVQLNDDGSLDGSFPQGSGFVLNGLS